MEIVLIGSGNVATHLAKALKTAGEKLLQVYSPNLLNAKILAEAIDCEAINDIASINVNADLYILAVKDDVIASMASSLTAFKGLVVHTSGATDISVLTDYFPNSGVFYPLQTFSKSKEISFARIPLCIEANNEANLSILQTLANKLTNQVYILSGDKRRVLHLSAVFACNFPNHLFALANKILVENDMDFNIIRPLIAETADKVMNNLPENVQSGPAVRADEITINKHLGMLNNMPELQHIYQSLSDSIKLMSK